MNTQAPESIDERIQTAMIENLRKLLLGVSIMGVLAALAFVMAYVLVADPQTVAGSPLSESPSDDHDASPIPVHATTIEPSQWLEMEREFAGQVEALSNPDLAFETAGSIKEITVKEGDKVKEGQVLARLSVDAQLLELERIEAIRQGITAQLTFARKDFNNLRKLGATGAVSQNLQAISRATRDELQARMAEVDADQALAEFRLQQSTLRAPFDGVVGEIHVDTGGTVGIGTQAMRLYEAGPALFRVGLPPEIHPEKLSNIVVAVGDNLFPARIRSVRPSIDKTTLTRTVIFEFDNTNNITTIGTQGLLKAAITEPVSGAWVPLDSMRAGVGNLWTVLVVQADNTVAAVAVEVLYIDDDRVYVDGAFNPGDRIVTEGTQKVTPGQKVSTE